MAGAEPFLDAAPERDPHPRPDPEGNDRAMELGIAHLLRAGVTLSALVVLAGGVLYLMQGRHVTPDYRHFHGVTTPLARTLGSVLRGARARDGASVIELGLLLLIATPIARVLLAAVGFLRERDRLYFGISLLVMAILLYSLLFDR